MSVAVTSPFSAPGGGGTSGFNSSSFSGKWIPQLWSAKLNAKFYATSIFGSIANTDWQGEISGLGDKITVNQIPDVTINDYSIGTPLVYQTPAPSTVDMVIDKAKYFAVNVPDVLAMQSKPKLMSMFTDDAANQMKIVIDRDVLTANITALLADATFGEVANGNGGAQAGAITGGFSLGTYLVPIALTGSNILQVITALAAVLDEQNVPETERALVISPLDRQILMQSNLAQAQFMGDSQSMLRNGRIGGIDRFEVYVTNLMPKGLAGKDFAGGTLASAVARRPIVACHKSAITFASQITNVENLPNPNDFGKLVRGLNVYGYKLIKPAGMAVAQVA